MHVSRSLQRFCRLFVFCIVAMALPWTLTGRVTVDGIPKQSVFVQVFRSPDTSGAGSAEGDLLDAGPTDEHGYCRFLVDAGGRFIVKVESPIDGSTTKTSKIERQPVKKTIMVEDVRF